MLTSGRLCTPAPDGCNSSAYGPHEECHGRQACARHRCTVLEEKENTQRSFKAGEVASYLETLYNSVAESLPEYTNKREDFSDSDVEDAKQSNILLGLESAPTVETQVVDDKKRFLPPGSMFDQYRQYLALGNRACSFFTFVAVWRQHYPHMEFRGAQQHAVCSVCTKHKLLIRCLGNNLTAQTRQRLMYEQHLAAQYQDRQCYWRVRGLSRAGAATGSKVLSIIIDSIDQQKCAWPRSRHFKSKQFDQFQRPRLHCTACICHGHACLLYIGHSDVSQCGSTTVEELSHLLTVLHDSKVPLHSMDVHAQCDNASSTNKNASVFTWAAALTQVGVVKSLTISFLRVGHTHEESRRRQAARVM